MKNTKSKKPEQFELSRLKRLLDVIFALIIFRIFLLLPRPEDKDWHWNSITELAKDSMDTLLILFIATIIVVIYWVQNISLLNKLKATDLTHSLLCILQMFFILIFMYSIRMGIEFGASPGTRVMESIVVLLIGVAGGAAWIYAAKDRRYLRDDISDDVAEQTFIRNLAEPLTALFTLGFAWAGWLAWELAWFAYPLFAMLTNRFAMNRIRRHMEQQGESAPKT